MQAAPLDLAWLPFFTVLFVSCRLLFRLFCLQLISVTISGFKLSCHPIMFMLSLHRGHMPLSFRIRSLYNCVGASQSYMVCAALLFVFAPLSGSRSDLISMHQNKNASAL
jgi:hypothetical protein